MIDSFKRSLPLKTERHLGLYASDNRFASHSVVEFVTPLISDVTRVPVPQPHASAAAVLLRLGRLIGLLVEPLGYLHRSHQMAVIIIGALLTVAGVVYMALAVLNRGRLSNPTAFPARPGGPTPNLATPGPTLAPRRRGLAFLGLSQNWPGLLMIGIGLILLLSAAVL